jgi:hypothetical protein
MAGARRPSGLVRAEDASRRGEMRAVATRCGVPALCICNDFRLPAAIGQNRSAGIPRLREAPGPHLAPFAILSWANNWSSATCDCLKARMATGCKRKWLDLGRPELARRAPDDHSNSSTAGALRLRGVAAGGG